MQGCRHARVQEQFDKCRRRVRETTYLLDAFCLRMVQNRPLSNLLAYNNNIIIRLYFRPQPIGT